MSDNKTKATICGWMDEYSKYPTLCTSEENSVSDNTIQERHQFLTMSAR